MYHLAETQTTKSSVESDVVKDDAFEQDMLRIDDLTSIEAYIKDRAWITDLKERAFIIGLMYKETSQIHQIDPMTKPSSTSAHTIHWDNHPQKAVDRMNQLCPLMSILNTLQRQRSEAESKVSQATEPYTSLLEKVKVRVHHLQNILNEAIPYDINRIDGRRNKEPNLILEVTYKMELWSLLLHDLQTTLSFINLNNA
jgi:hypothetical protein